MMSTVKVGCCGFPKAKKKYFQRFSLVEIQQTFYKIPLQETAEKWREEAPKDFEFSLKAWQLITHSPSSPTYRKAGLRIPKGKEGNYGFFKPSEEVFEAWAKTRDIAQALRAKVIVFQCPATFTPNAENIKNMQHFFSNIDRGNFIFAWEPRGEWSDGAIVGLCQDLELVHCVDPLKRATLHGEIGYFRLHGEPNYRHQYTDDELARLWELTGLEALCLAGKEAYVLFNNLAMYNDALRFKEVVSDKEANFFG
jgi:uncharacterized protein YecE (DUF72 family)